MFDLTYSREPVFFRGASRASSLCPQPVGHNSDGISSWRKLVCNGCSDIRRHKSAPVLPETDWKWLVQSDRVRLEARETGQLNGEEKQEQYEWHGSR
jgi:hypothetical protein